MLHYFLAGCRKRDLGIAEIFDTAFLAEVSKETQVGKALKTVNAFLVSKEFWKFIDVSIYRILPVVFVDQEKQCFLQIGKMRLIHRRGI